MISGWKTYRITNIKDTIKDLLNISNMNFNTEKYTRYFLDIYKQID